MVDVKQSEIPSEITFHFKKSNLFRVIHVDGAVGNLTPKGNVFMTMYSERASLPDWARHQIVEGGRIGEQAELHTESLGIMRELEVGMIIDLPTAKALISWLSNMINQAESLMTSIQTVATNGEKN